MIQELYQTNNNVLGSIGMKGKQSAYSLVYLDFFGVEILADETHFIWSTDLGHKLVLGAPFGIQNCIAIQD